MTADELKSMKKGSFIVMKTGAHLCLPAQAVYEMGHLFSEPSLYRGGSGRSTGAVYLRERLIHAITDQFPQERRTPSKPRTAASGGPTMTEPVEATPEQELDHIAEQTKTPKPLRTG